MTSVSKKSNRRGDTASVFSLKNQLNKPLILYQYATSTEQ